VNTAVVASQGTYEVLGSAYMSRESEWGTRSIDTDMIRIIRTRKEKKKSGE